MEHSKHAKSPFQKLASFFQLWEPWWAGGLIRSTPSHWKNLLNLGLELPPALYLDRHTRLKTPTLGWSRCRAIFISRAKNRARLWMCPPDPAANTHVLSHTHTRQPHIYIFVLVYTVLVFQEDLHVNIVCLIVLAIINHPILMFVISVHLNIVIMITKLNPTGLSRNSITLFYPVCHCCPLVEQVRNCICNTENSWINSDSNSFHVKLILLGAGRWTITIDIKTDNAIHVSNSIIDLHIPNLHGPMSFLHLHFAETRQPYIRIPEP